MKRLEPADARFQMATPMNASIGIHNAILHNLTVHDVKRGARNTMTAQASFL